MGSFPQTTRTKASSYSAENPFSLWNPDHEFAFHDEPAGFSPPDSMESMMISAAAPPSSLMGWATVVRKLDYLAQRNIIETDHSYFTGNGIP
jgi:hypothetical protein